ncbi:MAG: hypothetical protein HZA49_06855 [Planctomycetes bacterium]|nr:hypothetical protein [Planctomycetota bacterium]
MLEINSAELPGDMAVTRFDGEPNGTTFIDLENFRHAKGVNAAVKKFTNDMKSGTSFSECKLVHYLGSKI